jgi:MFS transporter, BCD family, chlorophyll transporter
MTTGDLGNPRSGTLPRSIDLPKVSIATMVRLGLCQMSLGMMSVLIFGLLNRVLIKELNVPATIATVILALTLFVAPARVLFGQLSDTRPLFGYHRTGYVWLGAAGFSLIAWLAVRVMWSLGNSLALTGWSAATWLWAGLLAGLFALYGLAVGMCSTPFATLLVDVTDEDNRSQIVAIDWSMLIGGTIIGAILISIILKPLAANAPLAEVKFQINRLFAIVPWIVGALTLAATIGVEKKYSRFRSRLASADVEQNLTLGRAWRILTANPQTRVFFTFLVAMTLGLFMQDPILETYGAEVFKMPISATTALNAFWGIGTLIGLSLAGFVAVPKFGKQKTLRLGCMAVALSMVLVIGAGFTGNSNFLKSALVMFGVCSGLVTTGAITLMLDFTLPETAGTFIGAWGLSQALARGFATIFGGAFLDVGKRIFGSNLSLAYAVVFCAQALAMVIAIGLLSRVSVREFKLDGKQIVRSTIAADVDG